jgi:hypothetical protein
MVLEAQARRIRDTGSLDLRRCADCEEPKPLDQYHANKNNWDGKHHICKECNCARARRYNNRARNLRRLSA